jgi:hypothetical protein
LPRHQRSAVMYCCVSTRAQEDQGSSLEPQSAEGVKHAGLLGHTVGSTTNKVYTGTELWDRPLLSRDRADLRAGTFQTLIAQATDRLSRDPIHLAIVAEECERAGAELIFVTEPLDRVLVLTPPRRNLAAAPRRTDAPWPINDDVLQTILDTAAPARHRCQRRSSIAGQLPASGSM